MDLMPTLLVAGNVLLAGCGPQFPDAVTPGDPPECGYSELARITSGYTAMLIERCGSYESLEECPREVREPVERAFEPRFIEWERCQ